MIQTSFFVGFFTFFREDYYEAIINIFLHTLPETHIFAPELLESRRFLLGFPPSLGVKTVSFREGGTVGPT